MQLKKYVDTLKNLLQNDGFWRICSWLGFGLLFFQIGYFLILYIPELRDRWEDIMPLLVKVAVSLTVVAIGFFVYFRFFDKNKKIRRIATLLYRLGLTMYLLQWFFVIIYWFIDPPLTFTQIGNISAGYGFKRDYVHYDQINASMKLAVLASEDQLFPDHDGFDIKAIKLALKYNKKHPKKTKGASTISQQVAKNIFLWQTRNFIRKGLEVYFTFMIETFWNKRKILARYLNVIETGPGLFGVQAAARSYFNKDAKDLSRSEAAMIAACLPNPKRYTIKPMSQYVKSRYDNIMLQMNNIEPDPDIQALIR